MALKSFRESISSLKNEDHRHLLLGNGFSQAWNKDTFSYKSLYEQADLSSLSANVPEAFKALRTWDFEEVIDSLQRAAKLLAVYEKGAPAGKRMASDAEKLKELLVKTIAGNHPEEPGEIDDKEYSKCYQFLANFERVYSLNYDLLLYWTLMCGKGNLKDDDQMPCDDGFREPEGEEVESDYVTWEPENSNKQNIYYLHGAIHLFESEGDLQKYCWNRTGIKLISQIRAALKKDMYPLFVSEGTTTQKKKRIMKSGYLQRGLKSLASIQGHLFVFGMAMSDNDAHVVQRIKRCKINGLWVGIFGDPASDSNKKIMKTCKELASGHRNKPTLNFFDSSSAEVWRKNG